MVISPQTGVPERSRNSTRDRVVSPSNDWPIFKIETTLLKDRPFCRVPVAARMLAAGSGTGLTVPGEMPSCTSGNVRTIRSSAPDAPCWKGLYENKLPEGVPVPETKPADRPSGEIVPASRTNCWLTEPPPKTPMASPACHSLTMARPGLSLRTVLVAGEWSRMTACRLLDTGPSMSVGVSLAQEMAASSVTVNIVYFFMAFQTWMRLNPNRWNRRIHNFRLRAPRRHPPPRKRRR